ncbi:IucA/IucC family protein [Marinobacter fonticola]|uniref:IucA/IucC family protein n=1 Tax=Marinobacter fonticola TaxID=2603215 RepID=UPI0011E63EE3|nr:IucA/IucC family protein [Marinobacter fonticola]
MNAPAISPESDACRHLTKRLIDTLIREDVAGCQSRAARVSAHKVPHAPASPDTWLKWELERGVLWLPVQTACFMQTWRWSGEALLWQARDAVDGWTQLDRFDEILSCLRPAAGSEALAQHRAYETECDTAVAHDQLCRQAQARWFHGLAKAGGTSLPFGDGAGGMLFYDRLAAFHDHPFYPSARAKTGFDYEALQAYAPEFSPTFALRWLAVPKSRVQAQGDLPECWPDFPAVGLDAAMDESHCLIPIHPHVWDRALTQYLSGSDLEGQVRLAPKPAVWVTPTLSVRTLQVTDEPSLHLKVPLTIRTLGARNIRTVKPSTIYDGYTVQRLLSALAANDRALAERYILTDESTGAHVGDLNWLGMIVRRYPVEIEGATVVPVAALAAPGPDGRCVMEVLAERFYGGDLTAFLEDYLNLTLSVHLRLWLKYGVALESNQQNSMLVLQEAGPPRLLMKDNDAPRLWAARLCARLETLAPLVAELRDDRILVDAEEPLAQMFTTITLQLNIAVLLEEVIARGHRSRNECYARLRQQIAGALHELEQEGVETGTARQCLLEDDYLYVKYLLRAGSLESKASTGATDINKFYGKTAPNFLRCPV